MAFADEMQEVAQGLLDEFGEQVTINYGQDTQEDVQAQPYPFKPTMIDGRNVIVGDTRLLIGSDDDREVKADSIVVFDRKQWLVIDAEQVRVSGQKVIFQMHCRPLSEHSPTEEDTPNF